VVLNREEGCLMNEVSLKELKELEAKKEKLLLDEEMEWRIKIRDS
jgi:hypothetical protein